MKRLLLFLLAGLVLAACAPVAVVGDAPAAGVTLIQEVEDGYTVFRLTVDPPVTQAVLRFPGKGLRTNSEDCTVAEAALECSLGAIESWYTLAVAGPLEEPPNSLYGVACRAAVCGPIYLSQ